MDRSEITQARKELRRTLYTHFGQDVMAAENAENVSLGLPVDERLKRVDEAFNKLANHCPMGLAGYEKKLGEVYRGLYKNAHFIATFQQTGLRLAQMPKTPVTVATNLKLGEYSDIIALWKYLDDLDETILSDPGKIKTKIEEIQSDVRRIIKDKGPTCETVALDEFIDFWIGKLGMSDVSPQVELSLQTRVLPTDSNCNLRLTVQSNRCADYLVTIQTESSGIEFPELGGCLIVHCDSQDISGQSFTGELVCKIKSLVPCIAKFEINFFHKRNWLKCHDVEVYFYSKQFQPLDTNAMENSANNFLANHNPIAESDIKTLFVQNGVVGSESTGLSEIDSRNGPFLHYDVEAIEEVGALVCDIPSLISVINFRDLVVRVWTSIVIKCNEDKQLYVDKRIAEQAILNACNQQDQTLTVRVRQIIAGNGVNQEERLVAARLLAKVQGNANREVYLTTLQEQPDATPRFFEPFEVFDDLAKDRVLLRGAGLSYRFRNSLLRWYALRPA